MSSSDTGTGTPYIIHIRGALDPAWSHWFGDMTITSAADGTTILRGLVHDPTALYGIIGRLRDLGLVLLSCNPEYFPMKACRRNTYEPSTMAPARSARRLLDAQAAEQCAHRIDPAP